MHHKSLSEDRPGVRKGWNVYVISPFHFGSSDATASVPASEVKSARIAGARVFMKGGLMNRAVRIFRFPSILMLGSALCCSAWAEQPSPKQSTSAIPLTNQNNSTSTDQKTERATDPSATAASDNKVQPLRSPAQSETTRSLAESRTRAKIKTQTRVRQKARPTFI
jgi:hypothetical protein